MNIIHAPIRPLIKDTSNVKFNQNYKDDLNH